MEGWHKSQDYELASLQQSWKRLEVSWRGLDHTMYRIDDMTINDYPIPILAAHSGQLDAGDAGQIPH